MRKGATEERKKKADVALGAFALPHRVEVIRGLDSLSIFLYAMHYAGAPLESKGGKDRILALQKIVCRFLAFIAI